MIAGIAAVGTDLGDLRLGEAQPPEHVAGSVAVQPFQDGAHILGLVRHRHQYGETATSYEAVVNLASILFWERSVFVDDLYRTGVEQDPAVQAPDALATLVIVTLLQGAGPRG
jgi:hypothetical protein